MTLTEARCTVLSANDRFKLRYPRYLRLAALAAVALTLVGAWLTPRYQPQPYQLRHTEIVVLDLTEPPAIVEPPAVQAPPRLPPVVEPVEDDLAGPDFDIPAWEDYWKLQADAKAIVDAAPPFVASSAKPVLLQQAKADYPEIARRAGLEGTVVVHALVGPDGLVDRVEVTQSVHPLLDRAAMDAARRCRFEPARQREIRVKAWVAVPYRFRLR